MTVLITPYTECYAALLIETNRYSNSSLFFLRSISPPNPSPNVPVRSVHRRVSRNPDRQYSRTPLAFVIPYCSHIPASLSQALFIRPRDILRALLGAVAIPEPTGAETSLPFFGVISLLTCVWCMLLARPLRSRIIASASSLDIVGLSAGSRDDETAGVEDGRSIGVESESDGSARGILVVVDIVWKVGSECSSWM